MKSIMPESAFPYVLTPPSGAGFEIGGVQVPPGGALISTGMDLRDYFASQVMASVSDGVISELADLPDDEVRASIDFMASACYSIADAMMKARETNSTK